MRYIYCFFFLPQQNQLSNQKKANSIIGRLWAWPGLENQTRPTGGQEDEGGGGLVVHIYRRGTVDDGNGEMRKEERRGS